MAGLSVMNLAGSLGAIGGGTVAMLLAGRLAGWVIRKISGVGTTTSYVIGVSIMTFVGAWAITYEDGATFLQNWILYVIAATIALPLMILSGRRKQNRAV